MQVDNRKLTVGLMTMHKVLNYGSALQTYALQEVVEELGYKVEIIDYEYPNIEHKLYWEFWGSKKIHPHSLSRRIFNKLSEIVKDICSKKRVSSKEKFFSFYQTFYHLSSEQYPTRYWLGKKAPVYDIYLTGSDQVWNPKYIGYDTSFMLSFVQGVQPKISYASSFSMAEVPEQYMDCYRHELSKYSKISVRERSGVDIVKSLLKQEVEVTCDPTLLLNKEQWLKMAESSVCEIDEPYMLIYILDYAYNPYPDIFHIIEDVHKKLNLKIVVLNGKINEYMKTHQANCINNAGPIDFVKLFSSASYIITTSFHGTAFALNLNIPFVSIVKNRDEGVDSRIFHLLTMVGAEKHALLYNESVEHIEYTNTFNESIADNLQKIRSQSFSYLENALLSAAYKVQN